MKSKKRIIPVVCSLFFLSSSIALADTGTAHIKIGSISGGLVTSLIGLIRA